MLLHTFVNNFFCCQLPRLALFREPQQTFFYSSLLLSFLHQLNFLHHLPSTFVARQTICPNLVYHNRVAHTSRTRYIAYRRLKTEGRPHAIAVDHVVVAHATIVVHIERSGRKVRTTGNSPFIISHIHPVL